LGFRTRSSEIPVPRQLLPPLRSLQAEVALVSVPGASVLVPMVLGYTDSSVTSLTKHTLLAPSAFALQTFVPVECQQEESLGAGAWTQLTDRPGLTWPES
jgi:hypothetical protein